MAHVNIVCEGETDVPALRHLLLAEGHEVGTVFTCGGKSGFEQRLEGFLNAARYPTAGCWLLVCDLDHDAACGAELARALLDRHATGIVPKFGRLRIAVRQVEAWAMADRERFATYFGIRQGAVPRDPDALDDPKRTIVDLARTSTRRDIRDGIVPTPRSGRAVGTSYAATLIEYLRDRWRIDATCAVSDSLRSARAAVSTL